MPHSMYISPTMSWLDIIPVRPAFGRLKRNVSS